jgi:hypothetical protein
MEYHVDHQVANEIIKAVVKNSKLNVKKYRYAIAWKYPFNLMLHTMGERSFYGLMAKLLNSKLVCLNISDFISLKLSAIEEYKVTLMSLKLNKPFRFSNFSRFTKSVEKFFV